MTELLRSLAAGGLWLLVFALFTQQIARRLDLRREDALLAGWTAFFAFQVLLARLLDLLGVLTPTAAAIVWLAAAAIGGVLHMRRRADRHPLTRTDSTGGAGSDMTPDHLLARRMALGCAALVLSGVCVFTLVSPVHVWDVLAYHMPMVASWVQNASLDAWPTQDLRQILRVNAGELQLLHIALLSGSDAWVELPAILGLAVVLVATFAIARLVLRNGSLPYLAVVVVLTAPQIMVSATTAKNDLVFTAALLTAVYWTLRAVDAEAARPSTWAVLAAFSAGLAAGTKVMGFNVIGATGLLLLVMILLRRLPYRALGWYVQTAALTVAVVAGPVLWSNLSRAAVPVGVAPGEVTFTTGPANIIAALRYYVFDLAFKRLVVLQMFEHDLSHYGYFFPIILALGTAAVVLQVARPRTRSRLTAGLALIAVALFVSVIAVRLPIRWDQRFMIWMVPTFAILGATLVERARSTHVLVVTTVAASFATFNLFLILSNETDGLFTRSATHLATTGELARPADATARPYTDMIAGYDALDRVAADQDSVLYIGSDDSWMYPAWGRQFTRYVRGVTGEQDALQQLDSGTYRFVIIEDSAGSVLKAAAGRAAAQREYRVLHEGGARVILQRPD